MKRLNIRLKLLISSLLILGLIFPAALNLQAAKAEEVTMPQAREENMLLPDRERKAPEYVPGQLIVKLKEGKTLDDLKELNTKYNVSSTEQVFKKEPSAQETLQQLKNKLGDLSNKHDSWYWQMDKNSKEYKEYIVKIEKEKEELQGQIKAQEKLVVKLKERQKKAPKDAVVPHLENIYKLEIDSSRDVLQAVEEYKANPAVEYAEPNYFLKLLFTPNDLFYSDQWSHQRTEAEAGWDITTGSQDVIIAIVDTGVDYNHQDLKENIWRDSQGQPGKDFYDSWHNPKPGNYSFDSVGHGTKVAGVAAARGGNGIGIAGVCHKCKIMPLKAAISEAGGVGSDVAAAIYYATDNGVDIINISMGYVYRDPILKAAVDYAYKAGVVIVAGAGNSNFDIPVYPAAFTNVIAVGGTDKNDKRVYNSNYGEWVDVAAPGTGIITTMPGDVYASSVYGTSFASPYVAGLAGLLLSARPELSNEAVREIIQLSVDKISDPEQEYAYGYGRVNVRKALQLKDIEIILNTSPTNNFFKGSTTISGSAYLPPGIFRSYRLYYASVDRPEARVLIKESNTPVRNGVLAVWDTGNIPDQKYLLILEISYGEKDEKVTSSNIVTVDNINQPPVITTAKNKAAIIGRQLQFKIEAVDPDSPQTPAGQLSYAALGLPPGAVFDPATQLFTWGPSPEQMGEYDTTFTIRDNRYTAVKVVHFVTIRLRELISLPDAVRPLINENRLFFSALRSGKNDIFMYDLVSKKERQITNGPREISYYPEAFSADKLTYVTKTPDFATNVRVFDFIGDKDIAVTDDKKGHDQADSDGDRVVWSDYRYKIGDIYSYDLAIGKEDVLANSPSHEFQPQIEGDKASWLESIGNAKCNIYLYNLRSRSLEKLTTPKDWPSYVLISYILGEDKVVWTHRTGKRDDIIIYEISTRRKTQLPPVESVKYDLSGYKDKIVWSDGRNSVDQETLGDLNLDIYMYDLTKDMEIQLTDTPVPIHDTNTSAQEFNAVLYGDKVAWMVMEWRAKEIRYQDMIYLTQLFFKPKIISVEPAIVSSEGLVTIRGGHFAYNQGDSKVVLRNSLELPVENWSDAQITCRVPIGAVSGLLKIVTYGGESNYAMLNIKPSSGVPPTLDYFEAKAISQSQIQLKWIYHNKPVTWDGFKIERALQENGPFTQIATIPQGPYIDSNLNPGTKYYYRIKAYNQVGDSVSSEAFATAHKPVENNPVGTEPALGRASVSEKPVIPPAAAQAPAPASQGVIREIVLLSPATKTMPETKPQAAREESTTTPKLEKAAEPKAAPKPKEEKKAAEPKEEKPALQEEQPAAKSSPSINLLATHNENGTLKAIRVLDNSARPLRDYAIRQDKQAPIITLTSGDTQVQVALNERSKAAQVVRVTKGAGYAEVKKEVPEILSFMGYELK